MARRTKPSWLDDWIEMAARLPWWLGVGLAAVSYFGLHWLVEKPLPTGLSPAQFGSFAASALGRAMAIPGQYLLPFVFTLGAVISGFKRSKAAQLHHAVACRTDGLASVTWQEFEVLVAEYFRREGYAVTDNGGGGPDGGVDVLLKKGGKRYLVQCKHWRAMRVGVQPVRELYGVMAAHRAGGGFVVTSGRFTEEAVRFADGLELELIDGLALQHGIRAQGGWSLGRTEKPHCPQCQAPMVLRQAGRGAAPGKPFWGCSGYAKTRCRGTREVA